MKLEFIDEIQRDAIDLYFEIKDSVERDITAINAKINWSLVLESSSWGIESFNYELKLLVMAIDVDSYLSKDNLENTKLYAEVKFNSNRNERSYICRIYEEVQKDNKWIEEEYVQFPIDFIVEEKPSNDSDNRSQIFVKYIELDLSSEKKQLKLTI
jgi:hypothetical protein